MICPNCGKELSENALFCRYCGVPVTADSSPVSAPMSPAGITPMPPADITLTPPADSAPAAELPVPGKKKHIRRALVSLLLFVIFAGGLTVSGRFAFKAWQECRAPYQEAAFAALDEELAKREECVGKMEELDVLLKSNTRETEELVSELARYRIQREDEILDTLTDSVEFDYDALFATEFFSSAYVQYINDLLKAFRRDTLTDSWLYSYYAYSAAYGSNNHIGQDLWIYDSDAADEKFSGLLDPQRFCVSVYTATLSDHLAQNDHLYVTGMDMLNTLFRIPGYVLDDAVFVKAYGGSPDPSEMEVPGWSPEDYNSFWASAGSSSDSSYAVWEASGLSALDFDIDWNDLVNEDAYYKAYEKFMNTVAPGLARYGRAQYVPDDDYYGGVRYELPGNEASLREIAAAYIAKHPDCLTELGINTEALPSSYDDQIAEVKLRLEELSKAAGDLTLQKSEVQWLQDSNAFFRQQREALLAMEQQHRALFTRALWIFAFCCIFLFLMAAGSLRRFIRALR